MPDKNSNVSSIAKELSNEIRKQSKKAKEKEKEEAKRPKIVPLAEKIEKDKEEEELRKDSEFLEGFDPDQVAKTIEDVVSNLK